LHIPNAAARRISHADYCGPAADCGFVADQHSKGIEDAIVAKQSVVYGPSLSGQGGQVAYGLIFGVPSAIRLMHRPDVEDE
jgi:hypothetical protein